MDKLDFLFELGTEELPPKSLKKLSCALAESFSEQLLKEQNLKFDNQQIFATPRRIAVLIEGLITRQPDKEIEKRGPALQAAYDQDNNPTKAALGFAKSCNVDVTELIIRETSKGSWLTFNTIEEGLETRQLLPEITKKALTRLPVPKKMRWGSNRAEFVRPVKWMVLLYGSETLDCEILGLKSGNNTFGHRFHCDKPLNVKTPGSYEHLLEKDGFVIPSFTKRRQIINDKIQQAARKINGTAVIDPQLLDEVTGLNEWPAALTGQFDASFLSVPHEALISSMKGHQKYFHVLNEHAELMPHFITITNIESKKPQEIIAGNEKVIRPRLSDAQFFYECDLSTNLQTRRNKKLPHIIFQKDLGSLFDKTARIAEIAEFIAIQENGSAEYAKIAGELCKSDLASDMVFEFPELQGIMGKYYAREEKLNDKVCLAIEEHYKPKFSGDTVPSDIHGCAVAIADKIDTIVGIFGINQPPTGTKDPFALRRSALGVLRVITETGLNLDLIQLIDLSIKTYEKQKKLFEVKNLKSKIFEFFLDRLRARYQDEGVSPEVFNAVRALKPSHPLDFDLRIKAVNHFYKMPESGSLAAANKRVSNIISKAGDIQIPDKFDTEALKLPAEIALAQAISEKNEIIKPMLKARQYTSIMENLAELKPYTDLFFDEVLVNDKDNIIRQNRYAMLKQMRTLFLNIADISLLQKSS